MQLKTKIAIGIMTSCVALTAQAGNLVQQRGYSICVEYIEQELENQRPKISSAFFLAEAVDHLTFYINAAAWLDGHRQPMRSECTTSTSGRRVLAIAIEPGRYNRLPQGKVDIEVAALE